MNQHGLQIAAARKAKGYTQEQLAAELHVSRQTVSHWETGRVLPDVAMAQEIARVLGYRTLTGLDTAQEALQENAEMCSPPARGGPLVPPAGWIAIGAALMLLVMTALGLLLTLAHRSREREDSAQALIIVTPSTEAAYLVERPDIAPDWVGWDVEFSYQNVSDVPFTPHGIIIRLYRNEELLSEMQVDAGYLVPHMGCNKLVRGNHPLRWPVGNNHMDATRLECTIFGVDDNGNELSFSADVHYINAFAH